MAGLDPATQGNKLQYLNRDSGWPAQGRPWRLFESILAQASSQPSEACAHSIAHKLHAAGANDQTPTRLIPAQNRIARSEQHFTHADHADK
jgi:hypothetical protein